MMRVGLNTQMTSYIIKHGYVFPILIIALCYEYLFLIRRLLRLKFIPNGTLRSF